MSTATTTVKNNAAKYRDIAFSRALYDIETDRPCTVTLTDGSEITGTFRDYSSALSSGPKTVAVVKDGQRRATRIPFARIRSVKGERARSLSDLLSEYIVQGDPAAGV